MGDLAGGRPITDKNQRSFYLTILYHTLPHPNEESLYIFNIYVLDSPNMRLLDDIRHSQSAFDSVVSYGGDTVKWNNNKGSFNRCPTSRCRGGSLTIGLLERGYAFYCHRCGCTGDAVGLLSGYQRGRVDTTDLAGDRDAFMNLLRFFDKILVLNTAGSPRQTMKRRREWARRTLGKSELLSTEQVLILAYASPTYCRTSIRSVLNYATASAPHHPANSLRRRASRWESIWQFLDGQGDDPDRWKTLRYVAKRRGGDGKYVMSAGARFFSVVGYYSVAKASPSLKSMAAEAGVVLATARRWWNYWVAAGIFTGRLFIRRKAAPIGTQLKLGLVKEVSESIRGRERVRKSRAFSREFCYLVYIVPSVIGSPMGNPTSIFKPPRQ